jgi:hypothetical protein
LRIVLPSPTTGAEVFHYLMYCTFTQGGETPGHGHFDFLVGAPGPETAKGKLRERLGIARARGDLFIDPVEIFLEDVIEVARSSKRGVIGTRCSSAIGRPPSPAYCPYPAL